MSEPSKSKFFTYEDGDGQVYIADSLERIPEKYQKLAKEVSVEEAVSKIQEIQETASDRLKKAQRLKKQGLRKAKKVQREIGDVVPFVKALDLPSVAVGFALSLVFFLAFSFIKKTGKLLLKLGLIAAIVLLVAGAYFGWLRRAAGIDDDRLASPAEVIDDAKKAATKFRRRLDEQERTLKKIEENSR